MENITKDDESNGIDIFDELSPNTLLALCKFYMQREENFNDNNLMENWQASFSYFWLSQFWYSDETVQKFSNECSSIVKENGHVACVCCPSLLPAILANEIFKKKCASVKLFEFDERFASKYPREFIHYDYRVPLTIERCYHGIFDVILVDPPFLSEECFINIAQTVKLLKHDINAKILVSTGIVMESLVRFFMYILFQVKQLYNTIRSSFVPTHASKIANEFACFTNYPTQTF
ncbi:unnamed protein product [Dracunculus medinensis]|uniref:Protein-lysine N-methyltransferase n=1 Tax=Dracunculus medinensis TaxID=318479 RepID=A0A0N4UEE1_DRAME|nr:unnamed protein product [Dracunculus medinensis]